eukprot:2422438-Pyramimonas_sp.AAC.1
MVRPKRAEPSGPSRGGGADRVVTGFGCERIENLGCVPARPRCGARFATGVGGGPRGRRGYAGECAGSLCG